MLNRSTLKNKLAEGRLADLEGHHARELLQERITVLEGQRQRVVEAFVDGKLDRLSMNRRTAELDDTLGQARHELAGLEGISADPDAVIVRIRHLLAHDLTPSATARLRKRVGGDPDRALTMLLDSVLTEAQDLGSEDDLSPIARDVLTSLVDRLGVRIIIRKSASEPEIAYGWMNVHIAETMRMSSNYSQ